MAGPEDAARVARLALRRLMRSGQGEERMRKAAGAPRDRRVAALAAVGPALRGMIGIDGGAQIRLVALFAAQRGAAVQARRAARMALDARRRNVSTDEWEAGPRMFGDQPRSAPAALGVATQAVVAHGAAVDVGVAAHASARGVLGDRSEVVVTAQAGGVLVRALQGVARLPGVIEREFPVESTSSRRESGTARSRPETTCGGRGDPNCDSSTACLCGNSRR